MLLEKVVAPPLDNNAYLVIDEKSMQAAVVDPALAGEDLLGLAEKHGAKIAVVLNTHGHPDPTADDESIRKATGAKIAFSLRRLQELPPTTHVYPGHGTETMLGDESWLTDVMYPIL